MEKVRYYIIKPNLRLFGGLEATKETEFDCYNDDKTVHQTLKDLVLTTEIKRESTYKDDEGKEYKSTEESKLVSTIAENTILVWNEQIGYTILGNDMITLDESVKLIEQMRSITNPIEEGTKKHLD
jgi:hypothetical protein|nr:MAG TPA: hypothetical protein [Caudoviricetes sp.]